MHSAPMQSSHRQRPVSEVPTVSSLYSQPSPDFDGHAQHESNYPERRDISPPDTPDAVNEHEASHHISPDVSPISATPSPTLPGPPPLSSSGSRKYASNLPLPKSTTKKFWKLPSSTKGSEDPESSNIRWDEYSGEPTAGDRGKPPSATPGSVKLRETSSPLRLKPFGTSTTITSNNVPPRKRVGNREVADAPIIIRPEWKGAGGRHSIVKPLFDRPRSPNQPHDLVPGSISKGWHGETIHECSTAEHALPHEAHQSFAHTEQETADEAAEALSRARERAAQDQREREREQQQRMARVRIEKARREREKILHAHEESERRTKEKLDKASTANGSNSEQASPNFPSPEPSRADSLPYSPSAHYIENSDVVSEVSTPKTSPSNTTEPPFSTILNPKIRPNRGGEGEHVSFSSQPIESHANFLIQPGADSSKALQEKSDWQHSQSTDFESSSDLVGETQLRSRFSATTIATTAYDTSPPQTPDTPSQGPPSTPTGDSILNRKRPVAPAGVIRRKPAPALLGTSNSMPREEPKRLPKLPPDADIANPIQTLQAKVDVLRRRRKNLESAIEELSNVIQPSSIAYDRNSRAELKKTLTGLEKELSEVVKDEHDTGLKLHRAWKRHEDFAAYEPTMIWVRRVTH